MSPCIVLAVETSSRSGTVALLERDAEREAVLEERALATGAVQGRELAPLMKALLDDHGLCPAGVDLLAVGLGPGSYTGLRVGIALVRAFAFASGSATVGVSSFEALAVQEGREGEEVLTVCPAGRDELYYARFRIERGAARVLSDHAVGSLKEVGALLRGDVRILGEAAGALRRSGGREDPPVAPRAAGVARLGSRVYEAGGATPDHGLVPLYLRRSKAEINWELRRAGGKDWS